MGRLIPRLLLRLSAGLKCRAIDVLGEPYLERHLVMLSRPLTIYLHRFRAGDGDRHLHDHPWRWSFSIVLCGGYRELRLRWFDPARGLVRTLRRLRPGSVNIIGPTAFHQIIDVEPETWTLFFLGPRVKRWGFLMSSARSVTGEWFSQYNPAPPSPADVWDDAPLARAVRAGRGG